MPRLEVSAGAAVLFPALYFFDGRGWFAALLPACLWHEAGHWLAVRLCGGRVLQLRLDLTGLCMETTPLAAPGREALCAAAGPAAGLLWTCAARALGGPFLLRSAEVSLLLTAFNLLPALPLDGGRILLDLTGSRALLRWTGIAAAGLCAAAAVFYNVYGLLLPGVLLGFSAFTS